MYTEIPNPLANVNADNFSVMSDAELSDMEVNGHPLLNELRAELHKAIEVPFQFNLRNPDTLAFDGETIIVAPQFRPASRGRGKRQAASLAELERMTIKRSNPRKEEKERRKTEKEKRIVEYGTHVDNRTDETEITFNVDADRLERNERLFARLIGIELD